MKQVFTNRELPHIWAQQSQESGRTPNGSFYFEGATIYSYGKHFPIATMEGNDVLFTMRRYSNTTAKHISKAWSAISHKNKINCFDVPVKYYGDKKPLNKQSFTQTHEYNTKKWKAILTRLFAELGNKRNRDISGRVNEINRNIDQLTRYYAYFGLKIKDKELKKLLAVAAKSDFIDIARKATEKEKEAREKKMLAASKAYDQYLTLWRNFDNEGIKELPQQITDLAAYYMRQTGAFTRLRFNTDQNRVETSKGVQIPAAIAKKAYIQLNGCMEGTCESIAVPVLDYTITRTTKETIIAGCHTIPKEDVRYIAELLKW